MINIFSETATLQEVLMHYPGNEFYNFSILNKKQSLYDETPSLKKLQEEHLNFQHKLIENNVKVFLVKDLLIEVLTVNEVKKSFIKDFLLEIKIKNNDIINETRKYLNSLTTDQLVEKIISGILWSDITIKEKKKVFVTLPMINLLYQRDPFTAIKNSGILNNTSIKIRKNESLLLDYILKFHKKFKVNTKKINNNFKIEGGDILILNKDLILMGISERTSYQAIEKLSDFLINELKFKKILAVKIPKERRFMHLDTILTPVDSNKFVVYGEVIKHLNI
jgi:arginine deiminase